MKNLILCGVGGQGTVLASKILAAAAMARGENAHTAETIGMAQRGGSVVSHVRIGENACSPLIPKGTADVLIGFEPAEAVRNLPYLKEGGMVIVSSAAVKPVTASLSESSYSGEAMIEYMKGLGLDVTVVDGEDLIREMGSARSLNVALLAAACAKGDMGMTVEELKEVVRTTMKPAFYSQNLKAIEAGCRAAGK